MQELAPSPSPAKPIPYGLVSLWDMFNFKLSNAYFALAIISFEERETAREAKKVERKGGDVAPLVETPDEQRRSNAANMGKMVKSAYAPFKSSHIEDRVRRLCEEAESAFCTWREMYTQLRALRECVEVELKEHHVYHYPREKAAILLNMEADWAKTLLAFEKARPDVFAGVDCFALGHPTASVFHMMRVAEHGLRGLARERKIKLPSGPIEWATWQDMIQEIRGQANNLANTFSKGPKRDAVRDFYVGALGEFEAFKDEFRNDVMHARATYKEPIALNVMNHVRGFMERLSEKTNDKGKKIRWR